MKRNKKFGSILLIDVLGTKNRWGASDNQELFEDWQQFLQLNDYAAARLQKEPSPIQMKVYSFSDTILLTFTSSIIPMTADGQRMQGYDETNLTFACDIASSILAFGLALKLPFRGCISYGEFYSDNIRTVAGKTMIEAGIHHEQSDWVGIHLTPSCENIFNNHNFPRKLRKYSIPIKREKKDGIAINFLEDFNIFSRIQGDLLRDNPKCQKLIEKMNFSNSLEILKSLRKRAPDGAKIKYDNTLDFLNSNSSS